MFRIKFVFLFLSFLVPSLLKADVVSSPSAITFPTAVPVFPFATSTPVLQTQAVPTSSPVSKTSPTPPAPSVKQVNPLFQTATPSALVSSPSTIFADHLNPIDHARYWTKFDTSYDYAIQNELLNSAAPINNQTYVNPAGVSFLSYSGSATASRNGVGLGFELGLLLNPYSGIAFGAHYLQTNQYIANVNYNNTDQDSESVTLLPTVVPLTLDYYFFLPDGDGRFFLSAGAGYYIANVRVSQNIQGNITNDNFFGLNNTPGGQGGDIWSGNVSSAAVGFQAGLGREFAISDRFGFVLFAKGRYARISNFQGRLLDANAVAGNFGLATGTNGVVDIDLPSNITNANNEHYTTIDFTGFEAGVALNFYHF